MNAVTVSPFDIAYVYLCVFNSRALLFLDIILCIYFMVIELLHKPRTYCFLNEQKLIE